MGLDPEPGQGPGLVLVQVLVLHLVQPLHLQVLAQDQEQALRPVHMPGHMQAPGPDQGQAEDAEVAVVGDPVAVMVEDVVAAPARAMAMVRVMVKDTAREEVIKQMQSAI